MGKIKVSTLGSAEEELFREKQKVKREEKKKREMAEGKVRAPGQKGGERVKAIGTTEEEMEKMAKLAEEVEKDQTEGITVIKEEKKKSKAPRHIRSKKYQSLVTKLDHKKEYNIKEALELLRQVSYAKFDSSVELHINTSEKGLRGTVVLPHGTGKKVVVKIADQSSVETIVAEVEKGKIDFDYLIAIPQVMPKLARVARYLGPKGLMPNPKNGTISTDPEKVAKKLAAGEISWKTESDFPIVHQVIGKMSFKDEQLADNYKALLKSIGDTKVKAVTLKSTMSPGIKMKLD